MNLYQLIMRQRPVHSATFFLTNIASVKQSNFVWLFVFMLLFYAQMGKAQFARTTQQTTAEVDSSRGYWRLNTQAASRTTLVQFFGPNHQLLYVENLPEKWVKLSRKNQKQFDQLLAQLLANQLVASRIKTELLPPTPELPTPTHVAASSSNSQNSFSPDATYRVHAYVNPNGKVYLVVNNPDRFHYKIQVADQQGRTLYEEFTNHNQYRRRLDLSALSQNLCQVIVQINNKPFIYTIRRQDTRFTYSIQTTPAGKEATSEQNREEKRPTFMPVPIDL